MAEPLPRVVVDTCIIVDLLTGDDAVWADRARYLLSGHGSRFTIVLPSIVVAEVFGCPSIREGNIPKAVSESRVLEARAWLDSAGFIIADLPEGLAREAAVLAVEFRLKGPDAVVLATAKRWGSTLYTRDGSLLNVSMAGVTVKQPGEVPPPPEPELTLWNSAAEIERVKSELGT